MKTILPAGALALLLSVPQALAQQGGVYVAPDLMERSATQAAGKAAELELSAIKAAEAAKRDAERIKEIQSEIVRHHSTNEEARRTLQTLNHQEALSEAALREEHGSHSRAFSAMLALSKANAPALVAYQGETLKTVRGVAALEGLRSALLQRAERIKLRKRDLDDRRLKTRSAYEASRVSMDTLTAKERELAGLIAKNQASSTTDFARAEAFRKEASEASSQAAALNILLHDVPKPNQKPVFQRVNPPRVLPQETPPLSEAKGQFRWPVAGRIARRFEANADGREPLGMVFDAHPFANVYSPWNGTVTFAGEVESFNLVVVIDIGEDHQVVLAGLAQLARRKDDQVLEGELVGRLGGPISQSDEFLMDLSMFDSSPVSSLYLQMRAFGDPIDPAPWLESAPAPSTER